MKWQILVTGGVVLGACSGGGPAAGGSTCRATTAEETGQCIDQLNSGSVSSVEITTKIYCTISNPCRYTITSTSTAGGLVFGTPGTDAGFYRSGDYTAGAYGAPVFKIANASHVTMADLVFDDNEADANCPYNDTDFWTDPKCFDQIKVDNSNDISLTQLYLTGSKYHPISVDNADALVVTDSRVEFGFLRGIRLNNVTSPRIDGNYIYHNGGAGVLVDAGKNVTVINNFFSNNQSPPWNIGGGQINIASENSIITGNVIVDSSVGEYYGCGIEFHTGETNLTIENNDFGTNNGADICNNGGVPLSNVVIVNNRFLEPFRDWAGYVPGSSKTVDPRPWDVAVWDLGGNSAGWVVEQNCYSGDTSCILPVLGTLSVSPNPCVIEQGANTCSVAVSWSVNFASSYEVKVGSSTIANWQNGYRRVVDGISTESTPVVLMGDGNALATANVSGVPGK